MVGAVNSIPTNTECRIKIGLFYFCLAFSDVGYSLTRIFIATPQPRQAATTLTCRTGSARKQRRRKGADVAYLAETMAAAGGESISDQSWAFPWGPDPKARAAIIEQTSYEADWEYVPDTAVSSGEVERLSKGSDGDVPGNDADGSDPLTVTAFVHERGGLGSPGVHMCRDAAGGVFVFKPVGKPASMLFAIRVRKHGRGWDRGVVSTITSPPHCQTHPHSH